MYKSPDLPKPRLESVFPKGAIALWLKALGRPDAETKCKAAEAIARAHRQGVKGLDIALAPLLVALDQPDQHPSVRIAAARALVALDARDAVPRLFHHAQSGDSDLCDVVEPALARWDYQPMGAIWLARLSDPSTRLRSEILAMQGLAAVREEKAVEPLRTLVLSERTPVTLRLEGARALARLRETGLDAMAEALCADSSPNGTVPRLAAAMLLERHTDPAAVRLLQRLTRDQEPAVAALAIERLLALDAKLLLSSLNDILASPDPRVRSLGVEVLRREPTAKHIGLLRERLDDVHPDIRIKARHSLRDLAEKKEWRERIIAEAMTSLAGQQWRSLEQAIILLTELNHKPAAPRFVELLQSERPEVFVAAAWGIRRLAVPDLAEVVFRHVQARERKLASRRPDDPPLPLDFIDHEFSQLIQFLGQQRYRAADTWLRQFIPKPTVSHKPLMHEARAAVVWALGMIHEGKPVPELVTVLQERLNDTVSIPPEDNRVRWMCGLTLGRMRAKDALPILRRNYPQKQPSDDPVNNACGWAIEQITGEKMPPPRTIHSPQRDWFLIPDKVGP